LAAQRLDVAHVWAGVDNAWEYKKLEARKKPENATREASYTSGVRFVQRLLFLQ
jgi:hypothetical protein